MSRKINSIYVAATSQHVGKTTSTLGLVAAALSRKINVGYCKPVGQGYVEIENFKVDKDCVLFADLIGFDIQAELHSPIILDKGATEKLIETEDLSFLYEKIDYARAELEKKHDFVIYEGTGHPGVGSVGNVSNADVAQRLNSGVVMVVEGGIGSTLDRLNMSIALFREKNVPIIGVIINKVIPEKRAKVQHYCNQKLKEWGYPLLGVMPYDRTLGYPLMSTITRVINGEVVANEHKLHNKVEDILPGSLIDQIGRAHV